LIRSSRALQLASAPAARQVDVPVLPSQDEESGAGLSLAQIFAIVWAYRVHTIIIAATLSIFTAVFAKMLPKTYTSTATLMISYEVKEGGKEYAINALGSYVSTQMDLIRSAEVLLPVIDRLDLDQDPEFAAGYRGDGSTLGPYVQQNLNQNLEIFQGAQGNQLLYLTAAAHDPVKAAKIANTVADVYLEKSRRWVNDPANERAQRYSEQLADLQRKVQLAQDEVTKFRQKTGITDVTAQANDAEALLLANLESQLQAAQSDRRAAEARSANNDNATSDVLASQLVQNLKAQLSTQEAQLAQFRATLGSAHPKVLELRSQIDSTQKALAREMQSFSSSRSADLDTTRRLEAKLQKAVEDQRLRVLAERKIRDDGSKLVLELESAQAVYKRALDGYDQIMFASEGKNTNVSFVSRATPPVKSSKPNKMKLLMMGVMAGIFLGIAGPAAFELLIMRRIRCRDDFERDLRLPVLAEFDAIKFNKAATA
jgi:uncharacterized protein involved in exopolysaccharide biosynthesis